MNELLKAAEMALEALENYKQGNSEPAKALRQALAQHVDAVNISQECVDETAKCEHEPVAVWELEEDGWNTIADPDWMETLPVGTRLYTAPPKREWVGLTDDEIKEYKWMGQDVIAIVEEVQATLKEKNT